MRVRKAVSSLLPWIVLAPLWGLAGAQEPSVDFRRGDLKVSENGRYLVHTDGTPFFYLADTAWELFHRLNRAEAELYLENRRQKGFTVVHAAVLAELDGFNSPNANGHAPLMEGDPARPNEPYFQHVDFIADTARKKGLYMGLLPAWGSHLAEGSGELPRFTPENARLYGRFLGDRYRFYPNIIWILGGGSGAEGQKEIWNQMALGLREGDRGRHLITFHPGEGHSSSEWFHQAEWLAFYLTHSGGSRRHLENYALIERDYQKSPAKPCLDGQARSENSPVGGAAENGWLDEHDVRQAAYWAVFAGAAGHAYGCQEVWQMWTRRRIPAGRTRIPWPEAMDLPGAFQMHHLRTLLESRPMLERVPDQSFLAQDPGQGMDHVRATRSSRGDYAFVYLPTGKPVTVRMDKISGARIKAYWYNPRTGQADLIGAFPRLGIRTFTPPSNGWGQDWVLVLDDAARRFPPPGPPSAEE